MGSDLGLRQGRTSAFSSISQGKSHGTRYSKAEDRESWVEFKDQGQRVPAGGRRRTGSCGVGRGPLEGKRSVCGGRKEKELLGQPEWQMTTSQHRAPLAFLAFVLFLGVLRRSGEVLVLLCSAPARPRGGHRVQFRALSSGRTGAARGRPARSCEDDGGCGAPPLGGEAEGVFSSEDAEG